METETIVEDMKEPENKCIVLVTGGFDPIHTGHITMFIEAKKLGHELWVGLNTDDWLTRKKGKNFYPYLERFNIVNNMKSVHRTFTFFDDDNTADDALVIVRTMNPKARIIFANGGDRNSQNIPEKEMCEKLDIECVFGVGGEEKINSSSDILQEYANYLLLKNV